METRLTPKPVATSFILAGALAVLALPGCGKSPQTVHEQPGIASPWQKIVRERHCKPAGSCGAEGPFTVYLSGEFLTENGARGHLTADELASLRSLADPTAQVEMAAEMKCERVFTISELARATISVEAGESGLVLVRETDAETGMLCYRGTKERSDELSGILQTLMTRYTR